MSEERAWARLVDRRSVNRGDLRRAALLHALDELLRTQTLEQVNVAEISRRAGVTRSAFYFYFESKAAAVLALMAELYDDASDATDLLVKAEGDPRTRIRSVITTLFDAVDRTPHAYRALLQARASSPGVHELWDAGRAEFAAMVADMIDRERAGARAVPGPAASALAAVLLDLNDHALERHALGAGPPREAHIDAMTHIWMQSIYATDGSTA
ncbi:TetR family transcriptional regulator [Nocardioides sp. zg-536]|uniref:TetR family transcriptional regulator n=1 Tax=Nocardioides faecalis TaxID=2803858 RepID=A0A939BVB8_9ACTN|nr:TetR/AcrR family transcriptional regulator [Nocardioides faecalis]MBM9459402.1 TetR family transcriptional regulator [Nocardioides faecalis]MBS4751643.1 TetR family transcriptional regulator [Nocardioides faecalis]QVI59490.1 TetR family transcriptional regulator [Nocardioides faecalis]